MSDLQDFNRTLRTWNNIAGRAEREHRRNERAERTAYINSEANQGLLQEVREQGNRTNVLDASEMQQVMGNFSRLPGRVQIIAGEQPGTYRFHYENRTGFDITGDTDLRISPEALALAQAQGGRNFQVAVPIPQVAPPQAAPSIPPQAAPSRPPVPPLATTTAGAVGAETQLIANGETQRSSSTPVAAPTAPPPQRPSTPNAIPASAVTTTAGGDAHRYHGRNEPAPDRARVTVNQSQVDGVQQLLINAGLSVGSRDGHPDHKWGPATQRSFEQLAQAAGIAMPADLTNAETMSRLTATSVRLAQQRSGQSQTTAVAASGAVPTAALTGRTTTAPEITTATRALYDAQEDLARRAAAIGALGTESPATPGTGTATTTRTPINPAAFENRSDGVILENGVLRSQPIPITNRQQGIDAIQSELANGVGRNEAAVVESFLTTHQGTNMQQLTNRNGVADNRETGFLQSLVGGQNGFQAVSLDEIKQLRDQMHAAGIRDGQEAGRNGEPPRGSTVTATVASVDGNTRSL